MNIELVDTALEDLRHVRDTWDGGSSDGAIRRESVVLRRLLLDDHLIQAWRELGRSGFPSIECRRFVPGLGGFDPQHVSFATVGGFRGENGWMGAALSLTQIHEGPALTETAVLPLDRYLTETMLIVDGARVRRRKVIGYIVNKKGGAHFDDSRGESRVDRKYGVSYPYLDRAFAQMELMDRNAVFGVLMGIGQEVVTSPDIAGLL